MFLAVEFECAEVSDRPPYVASLRVRFAHRGGDVEFPRPVQAILAARVLLLFAMVSHRGWAQNGAQRFGGGGLKYFPVSPRPRAGRSSLSWHAYTPF